MKIIHFRDCNLFQITNWETWKELCEQNDVDPYKFVDFGIDMGGGRSMDYEYIGDVPEKEK